MNLSNVNDVLSSVSSTLRPGEGGMRQIEYIFDPPSLPTRIYNSVHDWFYPPLHPIAAAIKAAYTNFGVQTKAAATAVVNATVPKTVISGLKICASSIGVTIVICSAGYWFYRTRHLKIVQVTNNGTMCQINELREYFETLCGPAGAHMDLPDSIPGHHLRIAAERRFLERACCEVFQQIGVRFRDVGGSRVRGEDYAHLKHLCNPCIDSSDILRDAKNPEPPFSSCGGRGEVCPSRHDFPGALLCHSDYYLYDELSYVIRGHTFIINHSFLEENKHFHNEAFITKKGDGVIMSTPDGTEYQHPYNVWKAEGCIIGSGGAAVYARVYRGPSMDVYYAYPASGTYHSDDPHRLKRSDQFENLRLSSGNIARLSFKSVKIQTTSGDIILDCPRDPFERAVAKCGSGVRDLKFLPTLSSYIISKLTMHDLEINNAQDILELANIMCERFAFDFYSHSHLEYDPTSINIFTRLRRHAMLFARAIRHTLARNLTCSIINRPILRQFTPWAFKSITMPAYIKHRRARHIDLRLASDKPKPFRDGRPILDACPDNSEHNSSSNDNAKLSNIDRNQSDGPDACTAALDSLFGTTQGTVSSGDAQPASTQATPSQRDRTGEILPENGMGNGNHPGGLIHPGNGSSDTESDYCEAQNLEVIRRSGSDAICEPSLVLETREDGTKLIHLPVQHTPLAVPVNLARFITTEAVQEISDQLLRVPPDNIERCRHILHSLIKRESGSPRHSVTPVRRRILNDTSDELVEEGAFPCRFLDMGQTLPRMATTTAHRRAKSRPQRPRTSPQVRLDKELRQERDHRQVRGSKKHQSTKRRVSSSGGTLHQRHRTRRGSLPIPYQGADTEEEM
ncbi:hypothetical protein CBPV_s1gp1 [Chronic bee paralysis virus]|uniref:hypothetical protein n=1 Tax=Chronic bee paralysis virus TaxID=180822 RepID=UPI000175023E|nr:hypothetical protein CBPV_s1gp1 [Chronic bee paralysis virus]